MFVAQDEGYWGGGGEPGQGRAPLAQGEAVLLWSLRRLAPAVASIGPMARCPMVEAALIRQFGAAGQEIAMLLRCMAQLLAAGAARPLQLGSPAMAALTADEAGLLAVMRVPSSADHRLAPLLAGPHVATAARLLALLGQTAGISHSRP